MSQDSTDGSVVLTPEVVSDLQKEEAQIGVDTPSSATNTTSTSSPGTVDDALPLGTKVLRRVRGKGETMQALISILQDMPPSDENTLTYALYFLRVLDDPSLIVVDIAGLDAKEAAAKQKQIAINQLKVLILKIAGSGTLISLATYFLTKYAGGG